MNIRQLDQQVSIAGQIRPEDVPQLAASGFKAVVCNRPDGEEAGQPDWDAIAAACQQNGIATHYLPMSDRTPTDYAVSGLNAALTGTQGKVFMFCRTGARCEALWTAVQARRAAA